MEEKRIIIQVFFFIFCLPHIPRPNHNYFLCIIKNLVRLMFPTKHAVILIHDFFLSLHHFNFPPIKSITTLHTFHNSHRTHHYNFSFIFHLHIQFTFPYYYLSCIFYLVRIFLFRIIILNPYVCRMWKYEWVRGKIIHKDVGNKNCVCQMNVILLLKLRCKVKKWKKAFFMLNGTKVPGYEQ